MWKGAEGARSKRFLFFLTKFVLYTFKIEHYYQWLSEEVRYLLIHNRIPNALRLISLYRSPLASVGYLRILLRIYIL